MKKNHTINHYLGDNVRFSDFINGVAFGGKKVVCPQDLKEMDTKTIRKQSLRQDKYTEVIRDISKLWMGKVKIAIFCVETQSYVDYGMPLRILGYETDRYQVQYRQIKKKHNQRKDLKGDEYVSAFAKEDKVLPVVSFVLYLGSGKWDGAKDLFELVDFSDMPTEAIEPLKRRMNNSKMNLIDIHDLNRTEVFETDLRFVLGLLNRKENMEDFQQFIESQKEFQNLDEDAYDVIVAFTNIQDMEINKEYYRTIEEGYDMCKAVEDMRKESERIGKQIGSDQINLLNEKLMTDNRFEDLKRSITDRLFQQQLMAEYRIGQ